MEGMYTQKLADFIKLTGISITKIAKGTGITYSALTDSLSNACRSRELRVDEFFKICDFLGKDPMDFVDDKTTCGMRCLNLKNVKTFELVKELSMREGVTQVIAEPYENKNIDINGPAIVLAIID